MEPETRDLITRALAEDVGEGDLTGEAVVPAYVRARARIVQKQDGVIFGLAVAEEVFRQSGAPTFDRLTSEGEWRSAPAGVAAAEGSARQVLAAERTALNFLGHLSGIATLTAVFVQEVAGTGATILDTRKTTPGMRALEKAAVAAGGGTNHRMGLHDGCLIKDNHLAGWAARHAEATVADAIRFARTRIPEGTPVEVEVDTLEQLADALSARPEIVLLDNMDPPALRDAVRLRDSHAPAVQLEASGGVTLANVAEIAATGVDRISVGALTHSAPALDLAFDWKSAAGPDV